MYAKRAFETVKIYFNSLLCSLCWTQTSLCPFLTDANPLDVCLVSSGKMEFFLQRHQESYYSRYSL